LVGYGKKDFHKPPQALARKRYVLVVRNLNNQINQIEMLYLAIFAILQIQFYRIVTKTWWEYIPDYRNIKIASLCTVFLIISMCVLAVISDQVLQYKVESFDLNHDGFFTGNEITKESQKVRSEFTSDTWKVFFPFEVILVSVPYFIFIIQVLKIKEKKDNSTNT